MKLFLNKIFFFFFVTVFLLALYEKSLSFVPNPYTVKKKLIEEKKDSIKMVIVGSSRAFSGIIPNRIDSFSVNIANNSQSIYYDIEILKKNIKNLPHLKTIVFDINFFTFEYNLDVGPEAWRAIYYRNTFNIIPQTKELSFSDKFLIKMYKPKDIIFHINSIPQYNNYYENRGFASNIVGNNIINKEDATKRYNHLFNKYMLKSEKAKIIEDLEIFLESLTNTKIKVVFVQIPVSPTMYNYIDKKLLVENNNILNNLCEKYDNVESINMLNDMRFLDDDFRDSDHLNLKGAIKFSDLLNSEINSTYLD